jgi:hypothetical protein
MDEAIGFPATGEDGSAEQGERSEARRHGWHGSWKWPGVERKSGRKAAAAWTTSDSRHARQSHPSIRHRTHPRFRSDSMGCRSLLAILLCSCSDGPSSWRLGRTCSQPSRQADFPRSRPPRQFVPHLRTAWRRWGDGSTPQSRWEPARQASSLNFCVPSMIFMSRGYRFP